MLRNTNISGDNYIEWVDKQCELSMTTVQATHCFSFNPLKESRFTKKATGYRKLLAQANLMMLPARNSLKKS